MYNKNFKQISDSPPKDPGRESLFWILVLPLDANGILQNLHLGGRKLSSLKERRTMAADPAGSVS
jgi:hypothetical protein